MTPKQEQFCREYLIDLNATQAAIRAGYAPRSADVTGSRLLGNAKIAAEVRRLRDEQSQRLHRDADEVLRRLWMIVEADPTKAFDDQGLALVPEQMPDELKVALSAVKLGDTVEVKVNDRLKALELLGRHYAMFTDKVKSEVATSGQVVVYLPDNGRDTQNLGKG